MIGIYKITNPQGEIYIGCTIDWDRRKKEYKNLRVKGRSLIHESLLKYGWANHKFILIEECSIEDLYEKEIYWINKFNSVNEGLNIRWGGRNGTLSQEIKNKISKALKGRKTPWVNKNFKNNISKALKEYYKDPKNKEKLKVPRKRNKDGKCWERDRLVNPHIVNEIRIKYNTENFTRSSLSREYGVSWGTIKNITDKINSYKQPE